MSECASVVVHDSEVAFNQSVLSVWLFFPYIDLSRISCTWDTNSASLKCIIINISLDLIASFTNTRCYSAAFIMVQAHNPSVDRLTLRFYIILWIKWTLYADICCILRLDCQLSTFGSILGKLNVQWRPCTLLPIDICFNNQFTAIAIYTSHFSSEHRYLWGVSRIGQEDRISNAEVRRSALRCITPLIEQPLRLRRLRRFGFVQYQLPR